jgi:predicted transcriptional regulator
MLGGMDTVPGRVALLSFTPFFAGALLAGRKRHEFRRGAVQIDAGDLLVVYETAPVGLITGVALVGTARVGTGAELAALELSAELAGPTAEYLAGAPRAVALGIAAYERLDPPLSLAELGLDRPPRSYRWLSREEVLPAPLSQALARLRSLSVTGPRSAPP